MHIRWERLQMTDKIEKFLEKYAWIGAKIEDNSDVAKEIRTELLNDLKNDPDLMLCSIIIILEKLDELQNKIDHLEQVVFNND